MHTLPVPVPCRLKSPPVRCMPRAWQLGCVPLFWLPFLIKFCLERRPAGCTAPRLAVSKTGCALHCRLHRGHEGLGKTTACQCSMVGKADVSSAGCIAEWNPCQPPLTVRKTSSGWQPSWLPSWGLPRCPACSWCTSSLSQRSSCRQSSCPNPAHRLQKPLGGTPSSWRQTEALAHISVISA